jgi:hypothetical protein
MPDDKTIDFVVAFLAIGLLALGVGSWLLGWLVRTWDRVMSRTGADLTVELQTQDAQDRAFRPSETNFETDETPQRVAENRAELICFGETEALARLIVAEKIGLTDAVKIGAAAKSGEKYQRRSQDIKAAVERLKEPEFPALAAQQRPSIVEKL